MLIAAALLLAGASDGTALLEAFAAPCAHVEDFDKTRAEALRSGWEEVADGADPRLARLEKFGRDALAGDDGTLSGARYRRTVDGRQVFLVVSRYEIKSGGWGNGCRVYDFDAPAAIDQTVAERWIGKPPTGSDAVPGVTRILWEPWVSGRTFELNYVPAGHALGEQMGLVGVILVSQAIGGF